MTRPETQRNAFREIENKEQKQMKVLAMISHYGSATLFELVKYLNWPVNRISGRLTELKNQGLIFDSGHRRKNPESNKSAIVWRAK